MPLNQVQRKNHPQAKLIPDSMWFDAELFDGRLSNELIALMEASEATLLSQVRGALSRIYTAKERQCAWLAIALSHPDMAWEKLKDFAFMLRMSHVQLFNTAALVGNLSILQSLAEDHYGTNWLKARIFSEDYALFKKAARHNQLPVLQFIEVKCPRQRERRIVSMGDAMVAVTVNGQAVMVDTLHEMILADNYRAFRWAAYYGDIDMLDYFEQKHPTAFQAMIAAKNYDAFKGACLQTRPDVAMHLMSKVPDDKLQAMLKDNDYEAIKNMAKSGLLALFEALEVNGRGVDLPSIVEKKRAVLFINAAESCNIKLLEYLAKQPSHALKEMMMTDDCAAFRKAVEQDHLHELEYLETLMLTDEMLRMVRSNNYESFMLAAGNGSLSMFQYLEKSCLSNPKILQEMIAANNYAVFKQACASGQLHIVQYLESMTSANDLLAMIKANKYESYQKAAQGGHLEILQYLEKKSPARIKDMIGSNNFAAFRLAGSHRHENVLLHLEEKRPKALTKMIKARKYEAFNVASDTKQPTADHMDVITYLLQKARPKAVKKMIQLHGRSVFMDAVYKNMPRLIRFLLSNTQPKELYDMLTDYSEWTKAVDDIELITELTMRRSLADRVSHSYNPFKKLKRKKAQEESLTEELHDEFCCVFKMAAHLGKFEVADNFLRIPDVFKFADKERETYIEYLNFFIQDRMTELRYLMSIEHTYAISWFLSPSEMEAKLYFYILNNLLSRKDQTYSEDIRVLLEVPSIQTLIHNHANNAAIKGLIAIALEGNNAQAAEALTLIREKPINEGIVKQGTGESISLGKKSLIKAKTTSISNKLSTNLEPILEIEETNSNKTTGTVKQFPQLSFFKPTPIKTLGANTCFEITGKDVDFLKRSMR